MDRRIHFFKGLAIIGVLVLHASSSRHTIEARLFMDKIQSGVFWSVPLFLFCAGALHKRSWGRRPRSFLEYAKTRFHRLMVPYFVLSFIYACVWWGAARIWIPEQTSPLSDSWLYLLWVGPAYQLYFLPLLFGISVTVHPLLGRSLYVTAGLLAIALCFYPFGPFAGRHWGTLVWGFLAYLAGSELEGRLDSLPLPKWPYIERIGEASGTIFLWHLPFVLAPLIILGVSVGESPLVQVATSLFAVLLTTAFLTFAHFKLKAMKLGWLTF